MITGTLETIAAMANGQLIGSKDERIVKGVEIDSRKIEPGMLFVPIIGKNSDGHSFLKQVEPAAAAMLWQSDHPLPETHLPLIVVENTQTALQSLAREYLKQVNPLVIGITGSNGKTSCKDMFASVLAQKYKTHATPGNRNNEIGLPLTILEMDGDVQALVLEMGMEGFHEIELLTSIAPVDLAVITSIGSAHMENLGSRRNIAAAKLEILDGLKEGGTLYWNAQSEDLRALLKEKEIPAGKEVIAFSKDAALMLKETVEDSPAGVKFETTFTSRPFFLAGHGRFLAENALPVIAGALKFGLDEDQIEKGLAGTVMTGMRCALKPAGDAMILDDSYKSNPESARAGIDTLLSLPAKRHAAVLSDMLDLGEESEALHFACGQYAKEHGVDLLYAWGPLSRKTAEGFGEGARYFTEKEDLTAALKEELQEGTILLIKGSRAMKMDEVVRQLQEGNEE